MVKRNFVTAAGIARRFIGELLNLNWNDHTLSEFTAVHAKRNGFDLTKNEEY